MAGHWDQQSIPESLHPLRAREGAAAESFNISRHSVYRIFLKDHKITEELYMEHCFQSSSCAFFILSTKMAQQALKVKPKEKTRITKKQQNPKKAAPRIIKPKNNKKNLQTISKVGKSYSVTASTEKLISSRVGHLEILKGSRREIEKDEKLKKKVAAQNGK